MAMDTAGKMEVTVGTSSKEGFNIGVKLPSCWKDRSKNGVRGAVLPRGQALQLVPPTP